MRNVDVGPLIARQRSLSVSGPVSALGNFICEQLVEGKTLGEIISGNGPEGMPATWQAVYS